MKKLILPLIILISFCQIRAMRSGKYPDRGCSEISSSSSSLCNSTDYLQKSARDEISLWQKNQNRAYRFQKYINSGLFARVESGLEKYPYLREVDPIGRLLWQIWKEKRIVVKFDELQFNYINPSWLFSTMEWLAVKGNNEEYINYYHSALQVDKELRVIAFPHHYNIFDRIFPSYRLNILNQLAQQK